MTGLQFDLNRMIMYLRVGKMPKTFVGTPLKIER